MAHCQTGGKNTTGDCAQSLCKGSIFKDVLMRVPKNMHSALGER